MCSQSLNQRQHFSVTCHQLNLCQNALTRLVMITLRVDNFANTTKQHKAYNLASQLETGPAQRQSADFYFNLRLSLVTRLLLGHVCPVFVALLTWCWFWGPF